MQNGAEKLRAVSKKTKKLWRHNTQNKLLMTCSSEMPSASAL